MIVCGIIENIENKPDKGDGDEGSEKIDFSSRPD
jgi:hypothetical protein